MTGGAAAVGAIAADKDPAQDLAPDAAAWAAWAAWASIQNSDPDTSKAAEWDPDRAAAIRAAPNEETIAADREDVGQDKDLDRETTGRAAAGKDLAATAPADITAQAVFED
ncbi:hypothetical protein AA23498_2183 [Acetobacter nitrogenifigens DSM 23921 = NBRC 105050]|uniref:Uncharacterized protein n=1 Tax=Acetobacter nitrogenifigens DSM 23921 = NBRC 105050 TaxID=1120919 RepID=A0A511X6W1_9PROT|nr:hypothetical protein AA23498_2183 [Acetobacter nitrogenifigens DSM 23921 = NBRC 105050]GEN58687.1 hypothetical protein ANI02nite_05710 [Acetobacter nitrogenifigens DSM 23921 = NBRC 105050]